MAKVDNNYIKSEDVHELPGLTVDLELTKTILGTVHICPIFKNPHSPCPATSKIFLPPP